LVSTNKQIGKEFIQLLHDYRAKKVNSSHLGLGQLFNPLELYNYLRNHHWKEGIPASFVKEWSEMKLSQYELTEQDQLDFDNILKQLNLNLEANDSHVTKMTPYKQILANRKSSSIVPSPTVNISDWEEFKARMYSQLNVLEKSADKILVMEPESQSEILATLTALAKLIPNKVTNHIEEIVEVIPQIKPKEKPPIIFVDTTNILNEDRDADGRLKVENIAKISRELESQGYDYEHIIDASSRYRFNDLSQIDILVSEKKVTKSPYGTKADVLVLEYAKQFGGKILSNDGFTEESYRAKYGKEWIFNNRLTCKFMRGKFVIFDI